MIFLATVPHTGTHTARAILGRCESGLVNDAGCLSDHVYLDDITQSRLRDKAAQAEILVTTMRNPLDVARGWMKRGRPLVEFFPMWESLIKLRSEAESYWLPVDTPDRAEYLSVISKRVGQDLSTDWPVINQSVKQITPDDDYTLSDVAGWCRDRGWFKQFGYEI